MTALSQPGTPPNRWAGMRRGALALGLGLGLCLLSSLAGEAMAQSVNVDLGTSGGSTTARIIQLVGLLTVLSVAPGLLIMVTSFTRIVVVLSILRQALATQSTPPNMVMVSLALFMTFFIMAPTFQQAWDQGLSPLIQEQISEEEAFTRTVAPFRTFMLAHVRDKDLELFMSFNKETAAQPSDVSTQALIPAFMISELRRAFEIGFLIFLPFVVIDMVIASVLMSMGMMMLPPMMLAMPFKLIFFVLVDGWYLVIGSLLSSYGTG
ncbi:flagellar biosynthetic protein FliP [Rhodospirillum rubrum]|uniref:flagellar type III secretion system pore protein FliP n=1 Tax=Rhodospirillum rubrum TaxID=1085 RepID=UPI0019050AC8|nr:flagellar type III secretion system pore protein FliP [Rhodospirillum rubrum]MBK1665681.1 flagellar biosynthetic protein FliP [Rhodospirillum rubrum]MBK1677778.1 flagellar biosynthetic protein FliP [Rhodospirillum rubrum]